MKILMSAFFVIFALAICSAAYAQEAEPAAQPSGEKAVGQVRTAKPVIEKIEGDCEYRPSAEGDWVTAKAGQEVQPGGALCTGFDSKAIVRFPENSSLEVGSLTEVEISTFYTAKKELEARLKVTVGFVRVKVQRGEIKSDFQVSTPHTTTAVKGTDWEVLTSYYGDKIKVHEKAVKAKNKYDRQTVVDQENKTDDELRPTAEIRRRETIPPIVPIGQTQEEVDNASVDPASLDQGPAEQSSSTNPDHERQVIYPHSG